MATVRNSIGLHPTDVTNTGSVYIGIALELQNKLAITALAIFARNQQSVHYEA
jgi:hypothetical protein